MANNGETKFFIKSGIIQKSKFDVKGAFNLNRLLKWYFNKYHIPFEDDCCEDSNDSTPVRFSTSEGIQYYNGTSDAWVSVDTDFSLSSLTAFAGGGQGSATQTAHGFNEITVSATAGDSVKLPAAADGGVVIIKNDGATAADVYPATGDTINDGSANAAIRIAPGNEIAFRAVDATNWETDRQVVATADGTVGVPAFSFNTQPNMGLYKVSSTQLGVSVSGALKGGFNASGLFTGAISEQTTDAGITIGQSLIEKHTTFAVNTSATVSAANFVKGYFTSTSAAAVTLTLDTGANIGTALGAAAGTSFDFYVDNTSGANTVTVAVAAGITAATPVITGGATLTISTANAIGVFRLVFSSASVAKLFRIG